MNAGMNTEICCSYTDHIFGVWFSPVHVSITGRIACRFQWLVLQSLVSSVIYTYHLMIYNSILEIVYRKYAWVLQVKVKVMWEEIHHSLSSVAVLLPQLLLPWYLSYQWIAYMSSFSLEVFIVSRHWIGFFFSSHSLMWQFQFQIRIHSQGGYIVSSSLQYYLVVIILTCAVYNKTLSWRSW